MKKPHKQPVPRKRGPEPAWLKINIPWEDAVKLSFEKKKPAGGWPEGKG